MDWAAVAQGVAGVVVDLDDQAVGADGRGGQGQGLDEPVDAGSVAGVHDDRQMGQPLEPPAPRRWSNVLRVKVS